MRSVPSSERALIDRVRLVPRDKASASEALNSIFHEVETLSTYVTTNAKELVRRVCCRCLSSHRSLTVSPSQPATVQAKSQPLVDQLYEISTHVKEEIAKPGTFPSSRRFIALFLTRPSRSHPQTFLSAPRPTTSSPTLANNSLLS